MAQTEPEVFDVVIFGASGFTGKYVIREALKFLSPSGCSSPLRSLAVAGRSRDRVAAALRWAAEPNPPPGNVPILIADSSDPGSLAAMVARARVVLSCAGSFRLYGHAVAAACAAAGVDCLDVSGEPEFMERVEADLHEVTARTLIVSACGFVAIAAELGFLFHSRQWEPPSAPLSVQAYLSLRSSKRLAANAGTYESAVLGFANAKQLKELRRSQPRPKPNIPGHPPPKGSLIEHDNPLGMWATILHSADKSVVNRTLSTVTKHPEGLPGVQESPEYTEYRKNFWSSIRSAHFSVKNTSLKAVVWLLFTGFLIKLLGKFSFGKSLLLKYPEVFTLGLFRKNEPTEDEVKSSSLEMWFVGRGFSDVAHATKHESKTYKQIITKVSGPDVGYTTTTISLIQCALILLSERNNLPKGGVYTPGAIFGPTDLQQRLQENGLLFQVLETRVIH